MKLKNTKLREGDEVIVVSGKEKGKRGNIKTIVGEKCVINDLNLSKRHCKNFKTFIFGNNYKEFKMNIKNKMSIKHLKYLKDILNEIFFDLKDNDLKKNIILFSPAGASFDSFKNFEDRGKYFNQLIKKFLNAKQQLFI